MVHGWWHQDHGAATLNDPCDQRLSLNRLPAGTDPAPLEACSRVSNRVSLACNKSAMHA